MTDCLDGLALWLADNADLPLSGLHEGFCGRIRERGVPIWRCALGLEMLHPEQSGEQAIWTVAGADFSSFARGVEETPAYLDSPLRILDETWQPFRRKLDADAPDMEVLRELKQAGATDYLAVPLPFRDRMRSAFLSYATIADRGFADRDIDLLQSASRLFSPYAERNVLRRIAIDLLDTYVGRHAGERIFSGQIARGAVTTIEAAILMCDMRGFTAFSQASELPVVVATLDAWFDCVTVAVEAADGEILKFMGDGLLAIFSADPDSRNACARGMRAARESRAATARFNAERELRGEPKIEFAMGLHVGAVAYGNVGGRRRLDFTVLGPAVNYASRVQDLAKQLGEAVLISRAFADCLSEPLIDRGAHPLRGIGAAEQVFAPTG